MHGLTTNQLRAIESSLKFNLKCSRDLTDLARPLTKYNISGFGYAKFQCNTRIIQLVSHSNYIESYLASFKHFSKQSFFENCLTKKQIINNSWHIYPYDYSFNKKNNLIFEAEKGHDVDLKATYMLHDHDSDIVEIFSFVLAHNVRNHLDRIFKYLTNLELFSYYFKEKACKMINQCELKNKIYLPKNISHAAEDFHTKALDFKLSRYYLQGLIPPLYLTKSEFSILKYYLIGLSAKQIAIYLSKSFRTIEKHLENIRQKSQYKDLNILYRINPNVLFDIDHCNKIKNIIFNSIN